MLTVSEPAFTRTSGGALALALQPVSSRSRAAATAVAALLTTTADRVGAGVAQARPRSGAQHAAHSGRYRDAAEGEAGLPAVEVRLHEEGREDRQEAAQTAERGVGAQGGDHAGADRAAAAAGGVD